MDRSTFEHLLTSDTKFFVMESHHLAALAARMRVPRSEIEDLVQEAWMSVLQHLPQFAGVDVERNVHCWLELVFHRKAVDLLRQLFRSSCESLDEEAVDLIDDSEAIHVETVELRECLDVMLENISKGNEENLLLFCLHFFQGIPVQDIAQQFDMTIDAVDCRIRRLLRKLRELAEKGVARRQQTRG